jgi:hypothetical protein
VSFASIYNSLVLSCSVRFRGLHDIATSEGESNLPLQGMPLQGTMSMYTSFMNECVYDVNAVE